jgi:hypothetical protein
MNSHRSSVNLNWRSHRFAASLHFPFPLDLPPDSLSYAFGSPINRGKQVCVHLFQYDFSRWQKLRADMAALIHAAASPVDVGDPNYDPSYARSKAPQGETDPANSIGSYRIRQVGTLYPDLDFHLAPL